MCGSEAKCVNYIIMSSIEFVMVSWYKSKICVLESLSVFPYYIIWSNKRYYAPLQMEPVARAV